MNLTEPQLWALAMVHKHDVRSPAQLGELMMRRPGIEKSQEHPGKKNHKAQAMGRLGGTMAHRLQRKKLIDWGYADFKLGIQTDYILTAQGHKYLAERSRYVKEWTKGA